MATSKLSAEQRAELQDKLNVDDRINPFVYEDNWNVWEAFKCLLGIVVIPVKLVLAVVTMLAMAGFCELAIHCGFNPNKPMGLFRRILMSPMQLTCRIMLFIFGYFWIPVKGRRASKKEAPIFVIASHSTFMDSFLMGWMLGPSSGLAKDSVHKTPLFGSVAKAGQIIPVKRDAKDGRKQALDEFVRRAQATEEAWRQLLVFPEGTCTNRKALIQFKKGAFVPGMPVQPVLVKWPHSNFDPAWTSSAPSRVKLILRLMTQLYNRCEVEFMPVYTPSEEEKADPILYAENVRQLMAARLGVPCTEHSYEDSFLSMAAQKQKFNLNEVVNFEFAQLTNVLEINLKEAKRLLRRFGADKNVKKTGRMDAAQFAKALRVPLTEPVQAMFDTFDVDVDGTIDFKTFVVGLTFISSNATPADGVEVLFEALDPEGTGYIDAKSLGAVLSKVFRRADKRTVKALLNSADPKGTGRVDKAKFKSFVEANPELLVMGISLTETYKATGRPISILTKEQAKLRAAKSSSAAAEVASTQPAALAGDGDDDDDEEEENEDEDEQEAEESEDAVAVEVKPSVHQSENVDIEAEGRAFSL